MIEKYSSIYSAHVLGVNALPQILECTMGQYCGAAFALPFCQSDMKTAASATMTIILTEQCL